MLDFLGKSMLDLINPAVAGGGIAIGTFVGILLCLAAGRWIGKRAIARNAAHLPNVGSLEGAVFALLGLMIAFTFSGALSRYDSRRIQVVDEANAIGTAWLRIDLLPSSAQPKMREAFRAYVDSRIGTYAKLPDVKAAKQEAIRSQKLQNEIWAQTMAALRMAETPGGTNILMVPGLNQMFDLSAARIAATQIHPPPIIYAMLIGLALASALLAGYQSATQLDPIHRFGFAAIIAFTIYVIFEIEYPRLGIVRIDAIDQLLVAVRSSMN